MKQASVVATVILAAAVLLAAYAIGRLIRQTRLERPSSQAAVEPNDADLPGGERMSRIRRSGRAPTPEEKAELKAAQAETLAQAENLTEEERLQRRNEMRQRLRERSAGPGRVPQMSPEELKAMRQRWPEMSEEERAAFRARMGGRRGPAARQPMPQGREQGASPNDPGVQPAGAAEPNATGSD